MKGDPNMKPYKIGLVAAEFNFEVTSLMIQRAKAEAEFLGVEIAKEILVPGVFEIPMATKKLLEMDNIDAVITLGAVITGETKHDEVVVAQASRKIMDLGLEYGKPVGFGVNGPGMTELQALDRIEKGRDVVDAVVKMLQRLDC
jgi:6,7-dimethyl-8-ribityllumazine synthase